jgi:general secretion pathway protein C
MRPGPRFLLVAPPLALCAWLHARGVSALIGAQLGAPELHVVPAALAAPPPPLPERSAAPILARNAFDSVTGPIVDRGDAEAPEPGATPLRPCEGVRVASIVASSDPEWSFAMLEMRGEKEPLLRRRGADVLAIGADGVLLERDGKQCVARIFSPARSADATPSAATSPGIVRLGPGEFVVDRAARDALIEGATDLMRSIAVQPEKAGDEVIGVRITTLKPGTPLEALGLRAGDVLSSLDGIPLTSPDRFLEALGRLRSASHIRLVVAHDALQRQLDYDVR